MIIEIKWRYARFILAHKERNHTCLLKQHGCLKTEECLTVSLELYNNIIVIFSHKNILLFTDDFLHSRENTCLYVSHPHFL